MAKRTNTAGRMTVVGYVRVSTEEQALEGVSLDAQEARIRAYCTMRGLELAEVVVDAGVSGYKHLSERDGGARVLELLRSRKVAGVVALKLDRLFRNAADCLATVEIWDRAGASLHLVDMGGQTVDTSGAMGKFFLTIMAGAAELERNQISERTAMAMQHKRSRGEFTGGTETHVRYGYRVGPGGKLVADETEQAVLALARELRAAGMSLRAVAAELASRGHVGRTGKAFQPHAVEKMTEAA